MNDTIDELASEQAIDLELDTDYETGLFLRAERQAFKPAVLREDYKPRPERNLRASRHDSVDTEDLGLVDARAYFDLVEEGHGFSIERGSNPDALQVCRYCGDRLDLGQAPCQFASPTHPEGPLQSGHKGSTLLGVPAWWRERPGSLLRRGPRRAKPAAVSVPDPQRCRCNGCRAVVRPAHRPEVQCGKPECVRAHQRERQAQSRARRAADDRRRAYDYLIEDSTVSDKDLAGWLDIKPIRVKEARAMLTATHSEIWSR